MTKQQADALVAEIRAVSEDAQKLGSEFSAGELREPPRTGAWSAADNLMHLAISSQALVPRMAKTLGKLADAGRRTDGPSRADWLGRFYAWALEPPSRVKVRAPRPFAPATGASAEQALPAFLAEQDQLIALAQKSAGLDLASRKVPSPVSRHIRYNVYSAFRILVAHQRRHLWQARRAAQTVRQRGAASE